MKTNSSPARRSGKVLPLLLVTLALSVLTPRIAQAALSIDVGLQSVTADTAAPQAIEIYVNNDGGPTSVGAMDFYIRLGEGTGTAPYISSVDLLSGTIFESDNSGQSADPGNGPQLQFHEVLKASGAGPVLPTGSSLIGTVSFVTAGITSGTYDLLLSVPGVGDTDFYSDAASPSPLGTIVFNGSLDVVTPIPEASTVFAAVLALLVAGLHLCGRLNRHRQERPDPR